MEIPWLTVFLDFPQDSFETAVPFWREVTGYGLSSFRGTDGQFATLLPPSGDAYLRVQRVAAGPGGCHLDLHRDPAEPVRDVINRLGALGAHVLHLGTGLVIFDSPGGFTFCVVDWHGERTIPSPRPGDQGGATRVDTLCLDTAPEDFDRECAFWAAFTGQGTHPAPVPGFVFLTRPRHWPVRLLLQRRDSAAPGERTRGHLDLGCTDPGAKGRHLSLGARLVAEQKYWTVLADPVGNEYCLIGREPV